MKHSNLLEWLQCQEHSLTDLRNFDVCDSFQCIWHVDPRFLCAMASTRMAKADLGLRDA